MRALTRIERAVSTYCDGWPKAIAAQPGVAQVNPESLDGSTPPGFTFRYIDISSVTERQIACQTVQRIRFADSPSRARRVARHGDTMICTVRRLLKSHAYAGCVEEEHLVCSASFAVLREGPARSSFGGVEATVASYQASGFELAGCHGE